MQNTQTVRQLCFIFFILQILITPIWAHGMSLFARGDADTITGKVIFTGGRVQPVVNAEVQINALDSKQLLATAVTDAEGRFQSKVRRDIDVEIIVRLSDGHAAKTIVKAAPLTSTALDNSQPILTDKHIAPLDNNNQITDLDTVPLIPSDNPALTLAIQASLQPLETEIQLLREEIHQYQNTLSWRDFIGSVGFILGIFALLHWLKLSRQTQQLSSSSWSDAGVKKESDTKASQ